MIILRIGIPINSILAIFPVEMTSFMLLSAQRHSSNFLFVKYKRAGYCETWEKHNKNTSCRRVISSAFQKSPSTHPPPSAYITIYKQGKQFLYFSDKIINVFGNGREISTFKNTHNKYGYGPIIARIGSNLLYVRKLTTASLSNSSRTTLGGLSRTSSTFP